MRSLLFSADRDGAVLAVFPTATVESYGYRLNAPGEMRFTVPAMLQPAPTVSWEWPSTWPDSWGDVHVWRTGQPLVEVLDPDQAHEVGVVRGGRVVWQGPLVTVDEKPDAISFGALDLLLYLSDWHIITTLETTSYPTSDTSGPIAGATIIDRDQHLLAKALIDHGQGQAGADRRLDTSGITASGVLRNRQYKGWELPNVWQQVHNLSQVDGGPDLTVDAATRAIQLWTPRKGRRRPATIFNDRNVRAFGRRRDRTQLATEVLGVGAGEGESTVRSFRRSSSAVARAGLKQHVAAHKDVTRVTTLRSHADRELSDRSHVHDVISMTCATDDPPLFSYGLGDEIRAHHPSRYGPVDEFRTVIGLDVHPAAGGQEETVTIHTAAVTS